MNTRALLPLIGCLHILQAAPSAAAERPVEYFSRLPNFTGPALSPDGERVAFFTTVADETVLVTQRLESGEIKPLLASDNSEALIGWYRWANNDRLLVSVRFPSDRGGVDTIETRLLSVNADDHEDYISLYRPRSNLSRRSSEHFSQHQDQIVDILPQDPQHILLALDAERALEPGVYRVNVYNASRRLVEKSRRNIYGWVSDQQSRVRLGLFADFRREAARTIHRPVDGGDWRTLFSYRMFNEPSIFPVGFDLDPDILYYTAYDDGGRKALYKMNLVTEEKELVFSHPDYDFDGSLLRTRGDGRVIGMRNRGLPDGEVYWDEDYAALQQALDRVLPDFTNRLIGFSEDGNRYLLSSYNRTTPAAYYLGDRRDSSLNLVAERYPELGAEPLYQRRTFWYTARDGEEIRAYLSLPVGAEEGGPPLPAVLFPHGGPHARQWSSFDYWVAFFTDRGYAVLSPDFRGSSGYGFEFAQARMGSWGLQMQDDITDTARWLVEEGIADPDRMCIVGGSYGGYAALMATVKTPDLFRCAVSFAGVSDLRRLVNESRRYIGSEAVEAEVGTRSRDLRARSPYHNVEEIEVPILLVHGEEDRIVDVLHSRSMADELHDHGKEVEYIELPNGNHHLSAQPNRHTFFRAMDRFLKRHLSDE